ncbi:hypothetical protein KCMC57_up55550 [Kitasatospora sp. CMC57]|uniref:Acyl-CoA oxidase n=1 Tax=Kitasatospora sp. CMC57 TaxID=3231513 RepID=A0AB33K0X1_9ACTN
MSSGPPPQGEPRTHLDELVHGPVSASFLRTLRASLSDGPGPAGPDLTDREPRLRRRLRRLADSLPPGRELLDRPEQLGALFGWVAAADPPLTMVLINHYLLALNSMDQLAPDHDLLKSHFEALERGRAKGVFMITEVGRANSHLATRTTAEFDPVSRGFTLNSPDPTAAKFTAGTRNGGPLIGAALARLVVAGADCGVFSFVVDLVDKDGLRPGVEMSDTIELSALPLDYAQFRFHDLRLPYGHWLRDSAEIDADGAFHDRLGSPDLRLQRTLCVGQVLWAVLPSALAAMSRQSAVLALRYARRRRTQGRLAPGTALLDYRTQQHGVLGALAEAFALTCAASRSLTVLAESRLAAGGGPDPETDGPMTFAPWSAISRPLSAYKAHTVRAAARITGDCQRFCGFSGHLDVNRLAAYHGFSRAFDAAGGDSQLIFFDLGRARADDARRPGEPEAQHPVPGSPGWWPYVLRAHEQRLTDRLRRLRDRNAAGADEFAVWNPLLSDAGELGETYAARLVAEDVARVVTDLGLQEPESSAAVDALAGLYGAVTARRLAGPLLTAGTLRPEEVRELPAIVDRLCDRLLPHLDLLERAFGYPQAVVGAPLGDPDFNSALADSLGWHQGGPS